MGDNLTMKTKMLAAALAAALPIAAPAVTLNSDGLGQALIFPYYTAQSSANNPFNTYLSIVNHAGDAKALRVRVREARNSREVASFNLFLSPNDAWTGAVVPVASTGGTQIVTADRSCLSPDATGFTFQNSLFSGSFDDGLGAGLDRTREGWIEVIEMSTLTGASAARITQNSAGIPANCAGMQGSIALDVAAPTGGLSGTLTLINVVSGFDFTVNAEALSELSVLPFYRPSGDSYPDFNAVEVNPLSVVVANGSLYRSAWNRGADAVSAVLMRTAWMNEYVLDAGTASRSDAVVTFPTRHFYLTGSVLNAPFSPCATFNTFAGQPATIRWFGRESQGGIHESFVGVPPPPVANFRCSALAVMDFNNGAVHTQSPTRSGVLGSENRAVAEGQVFVGMGVANGWFSVAPNSGQLTSLGTSTRMNLANGAVTTGSHVFSGLPVVGLGVRTFVNGTLVCSGGACQGNYGGSFPLKFRRAITPN